MMNARVCVSSCVDIFELLKQRCHVPSHIFTFSLIAKVYPPDETNPHIHKPHIRGYKRIMISQWRRQLYEHSLQFSVVRTEGRIIEPHINSHRCVF